MTTPQNTRLGIWLMIATTVVFAAQDGISRHLGEAYPVTMVVMVRFWFFALFAMAKDVPEVERLLQVSIDFF